MTFFLSTASLMVMGHSVDDYTMIPIADELTFSAPNDIARVIVWAPPQKQFEIHESNTPTRCPFERSQEAIIVRPAWGLFVATVPVLFFLAPLFTVINSFL